MLQKAINGLKQRNNPMFYVTATSQLLLAIQIILAIFGRQELLDQALQHKILAAVEAVITFLGTVGVFTNPITVFPPLAPPTDVTKPTNDVVSGQPDQPIPTTPVVDTPVVPSVDPAPAAPVVDTPITPVVESPTPAVTNVDSPVIPPVENPTPEQPKNDNVTSPVQGPTVIVDPVVSAGPVDTTK